MEFSGGNGFRIHLSDAEFNGNLNFYRKMPGQ